MPANWLRHDLLKCFTNLPREQWASVRRTWQIFKVDPFDARLGTHKIHGLSAIFNRTVYAVVVAANFAGEKLIYLRMSGHGGTSVGCRVAPPGMITPLTDKHTSVRVEMPD